MTANRPVKVLFCEHNVDGTIGGSYFSLLYLAKGLDRSRFHPIAVFYSDHALMSAFRDAGVETVTWPKPVVFKLGRHLRGWRRIVAMPLIFAQMGWTVLDRFVFRALSCAAYLRKHDVAIVHLNNSVLYNHDWMLAALLARVPCVTHERGINNKYTRAAKFFGSKLGAIICISDAVKRQMQDRGADFGNLITIHNGLDPQAVTIKTPPAELRRKHGIPADAIVVGMVGNIRAWKGQETLVRAFDRVSQAHPNARLVLVGDTAPLDRPYEATLRQLIAEQGLEDRIIFTGYQKNAGDYQMMFDIVVHASVAPEPFGRVVLEAMACKKPFIGSRAGAIPEIVDEGKTGITFPPGDDQALAGAITRLIADPEEAARMGERGYQRLVSHFHIDRNTDATERLYDGLLRAS